MFSNKKLKSKRFLWYFIDVSTEKKNKFLLFEFEIKQFWSFKLKLYKKIEQIFIYVAYYGAIIVTKIDLTNIKSIKNLSIKII